MKRQTSDDSLRLLPAEALIVTGPVDHADWNFSPLLGWIQRQRFRLILSLLPGRQAGRLLEIGYGSGIFMPTLIERCDELYGLDIHPFQAEVAQKLAERQIHPQLTSGSAESLPFADRYFDCVVAVSSLEFVADQDAAVREISRVLQPEGVLLLVTPGNSALVDCGLRLLTGKSARADFAGQRESLIPTVMKYFTVQKKREFPVTGLSLVRLYTAYRLTPHTDSSCN